MLVVDVETTSLDPRLGSIVSIGAVDFENPQNQFYIECRIWEGAQVHPKSLEINGMDEKSLVDTTKPTEKEAIETFFNWARKWRNQPIAGQNTDFDNSYLKQAAKRNDVDHVFGYRIIDLHSIAYAKLIDLEGKYLHFDLNNLSTENIYKFVGLPKNQNLIMH